MKFPRAATVLLAAAGVLAEASLAQTPSAPPAGAHAQAKVPATRAGPAAKGAAKPATYPLWKELAPAQQQSLAPLSAKWDTLNEAQKRKWLALSTNFPRLSPDEQAKLHSRMTEWAALSPQQRAQARLNFGETNKLAPDDKKAKWEAYQALSPEEKRKLAAGASKPPSTAAAVRPVPAGRLATVPPSKAARHDGKPPRIAAAPNQVDHNTLLPQGGQEQPSGPN